MKYEILFIVGFVIAMYYTSGLLRRLYPKNQRYKYVKAIRLFLVPILFGVLFINKNIAEARSGSYVWLGLLILLGVLSWFYAFKEIKKARIM